MRLEDLVRLRRARDRMDREYAEPLDVPALARDALMSPGHFSRSFRAAFGETPYSYLMTRRIERAKATCSRTLFRRRRPRRHGAGRRDAERLLAARHVAHGHQATRIHARRFTRRPGGRRRSSRPSGLPRPPRGCPPRGLRRPPATRRRPMPACVQRSHADRLRAPATASYGARASAPIPSAHQQRRTT
nr:AraC family transcriptional regulator [Streptomyces sp. WY228]